MGIGFLELVVIAVVALVLLGPQRLPEVLQQLGRFYVQFRRTSSEFKSAFDDVVRKAEEEMRIEEIRRLNELAKAQEIKLEEALRQDVLTAKPQEAAKEASSHISTYASEPPIGRSDTAIRIFDHPKPELTSEVSGLSATSSDPCDESPSLPPKPGSTS